MKIELANQSYGKSQVCLSHIKRAGDQHNFVQIIVDVALEGDFDSAYTDGDNSKVVPTDTMKNSVYAIAKLHGVDAIETYAQHLAKHFFDSFDHITKTTICVAEKLWQRIDLDGEAHGHAFTGGNSEENTCCAIVSEKGTKLSSGLRGLQILKTTDSAFEGYIKDKYTTLKETSDRIFATTITTQWPCNDVDRDWTQTRQTIRRLLLDVFAHQFSPSVQKTLYDMAQSVLSSCNEIDEISLDMPNQHHLLADLAKLKMENANEIFVPTPEPFGVISATIRRQ